MATVVRLPMSIPISIVVEQLSRLVFPARKRFSSSARAVLAELAGVFGDFKVCGPLRKCDRIARSKPLPVGRHAYLLVAIEPFLDGFQAHVVALLPSKRILQVWHVHGCCRRRYVGGAAGLIGREVAQDGIQ